MASTPMNIEEMLRFQMSLVRLLTPVEPTKKDQVEATAHPVADALEALVRKTRPRSS
jgi:hypothetical protein